MNTFVISRATAVGYRLAREDGYSMGLDELYATDRYLSVGYPSKNVSLFLDRKQGKKRLFQSRSTILSALSFGAASTCTTSLVRCFSADIMVIIKDDLMKSAHPEYHDIYERLTEDSNPVIGLLDYERIFK